MRTPLLFEPLIRSFYSGQFYYQVYKRWEWKALGYAAAFAALLPLMMAGKFYFFSQESLAALPSDLPVIQKFIQKVYVKDGRVYVEPVKDIMIVKEGIYTVPRPDGSPLAIINTVNPNVPADMSGAKYYLSARAASFRAEHEIKTTLMVPDFTFVPAEGTESIKKASPGSYIAGMYPLMARNKIMIFLGAAFLFVIPIFGVTRYFGMNPPFYKLLSMSIITLTPAVLTDTVLISWFNRDVLDLTYITLITIGYEVFAFYQIVKIEDEVLDAAAKAKAGKTGEQE